MSFSAVKKMISLVADCLIPGGMFVVYGPFRQGGSFSTESNANFDASLRARNPEMGIRELDEIDVFAENVGMHRKRTFAMPANNLLLIWKKGERTKK